MCPLKHFDLCPLKIFWLECAPQNATKFICGAQVSFAARALKIFICKEAGDKVFFTTKKQGKGVEHTNFCAVKNRDYSWTGLKLLFQFILTQLILDLRRFCRKLFFCRDYALFGVHFLLKFGGEGHKNILRDRACGATGPTVRRFQNKNLAHMVSRHDGNKKIGIRPNNMVLGPKNTVLFFYATPI